MPAAEAVGAHAADTGVADSIGTHAQNARRHSTLGHALMQDQRVLDADGQNHVNLASGILYIYPVANPK
jgi:hypothetical protein